MQFGAGLWTTELCVVILPWPFLRAVDWRLAHHPASTHVSNWTFDLTALKAQNAHKSQYLLLEVTRLGDYSTVFLRRPTQRSKVNRNAIYHRMASLQNQVFDRVHVSKPSTRCVCVYLFIFAFIQYSSADFWVVNDGELFL